MALRSRVSSIARQSLATTEDSAEATTEAATTETPDEAVTEDVGSSALAVITRGGVRQPAAVQTADPAAPSTETEAAQGTTAEKSTAERKRPGRKPRVEKAAEDVMPIDQMAAPQVRAELKELETKLKDVRSRHLAETEELRSTHRALHDRLFDLTK